MKTQHQELSNIKIISLSQKNPSVVIDGSWGNKFKQLTSAIATVEEIIG